MLKGTTSVKISLLKGASRKVGARDIEFVGFDDCAKKEGGNAMKRFRGQGWWSLSFWFRGLVIWIFIVQVWVFLFTESLYGEPNDGISEEVEDVNVGLVSSFHYPTKMPSGLRSNTELVEFEFFEEESLEFDDNSALNGISLTVDSRESSTEERSSELQLGAVVTKQVEGAIIGNLSQCSPVPALVVIDSSFAVRFEYDLGREDSLISWLLRQALNPESAILQGSTTAEISTFSTSAIIDEFRKEAGEFFRTDYVRLFQSPQLLRNAKGKQALLLLTGGEPYSDKYRFGKRALDEACLHGEFFRLQNPDLKVICVGSGSDSRSKRFHNCLCDAILSADLEPTASNFDTLGRFLCSQDSPKDPCDRAIIDARSERKRHGLCRKFRAPVSNWGSGTEVPLLGKFQCVWSKNRCHISPKLVHWHLGALGI